MTTTSAQIAVIGTGRMAGEYVKALLALGYARTDIVVVGRRSEAVDQLRTQFGVDGLTVTDCRVGPFPPFAAAIITVTPDALAATALAVAAGSCRKLLIEKPGDLSSSGLAALAEGLSKDGVSAHLAFNRRFYPSVVEARRLIEADGGPLSCLFEFTDLEAHVLELRDGGGWPAANFPRWGLVNSSHVVDLAFHLAGQPTVLTPLRSGSLSWHPSGSEFAGCGQTERGALFSYAASWGGAGRWRVEVTTSQRRIVLCPVEKLQLQSKTRYVPEVAEIIEEPEGLKPGLYQMLAAWLSERPEESALPDLRQAVKLLSQVEKICFYDDSAAAQRG